MLSLPEICCEFVVVKYIHNKFETITVISFEINIELC